ncbi:ABC transporter ATP-binding protein, partial [Candidatus Bathyarchaeota archaeon]|nr:ABC transporter ATP-binding protein [Candidatus Bathyarchaeota archaeon]
MPSLRLVNVTKRFGSIEALDDVTFNVSDGEYLCILGPTGSGKTTLLRLLAGLLEPDGGAIYFDEKPFIDVPPEERNVAYVPQTYALFPHMTVLENVMFGPSARGLRYSESYRMAMEALKMVRLAHRADAFPHELSGGMQQRVALARALASGAKLLLLDEPLGALDARLRIELRRELKALAKTSGLTVVHVTHDQEEAMAIGDRILVLRNGRVQQHGTPFHVYRKPENLFVASFMGSSNFLEGIVVQRNRRGSLLRLRGNLELRVADTSHMPKK